MKADNSRFLHRNVCNTDYNFAGFELCILLKNGLYKKYLRPVVLKIIFKVIYFSQMDLKFVSQFPFSNV